MTITVHSGAFGRALQMAAKVAPTRNTIPILNNALLSMNNGRLAIQVSDLSLWLTVEVDCEGEIEPITVPAHSLTGIVRSAGANTTISMSVSQNLRLSITADRARHALPCLPAEDWPNPSISDGDGTTLTLPKQDWARVLTVPFPASSTEMARAYFNGVYVEPDGDHIIGVGCDGHQLIRIQITGQGTFKPVIVPREAVGHIASALEGDGNVDVTITEKAIRCVTNDVTILAQLIDQTYPDYRRVIPADNPLTLMVDAEELLQALGRVEATLDGGRFVALIAKAGAVSVGSGTVEIGDSLVEIDGTPSSDFEVGCNARYLRNVLNAVRPNGGTVTLGIDLDGGPLTVRWIEGAVDALVMPMRGRVPSMQVAA